MSCQRSQGDAGKAPRATASSTGIEEHVSQATILVLEAVPETTVPQT